MGQEGLEEVFGQGAHCPGSVSGDVRPLSSEPWTLGGESLLSSDLGGGSSTNTVHPECQALGITPDIVSNSRVLLGNTDRWRRVLQREERGEIVSVAVLGGSVTVGVGCQPERKRNNLPNVPCAWPRRLEDALSSRSGRGNVKVTNLGRRAMPSLSALPVVMNMGPVEYDVVILHFTANDEHPKFYENELGGDRKSDGIKTKFETLVRTALARPNAPAVIIVEGLGWRLPVSPAEEMHRAVASAYDIPVISARAAFLSDEAFRDELRGLEGTSVHVPHVWHGRYACLVAENWSRESLSLAEPPSGLADAAFRPPVFGGTTMSCTQLLGASAFEGTLAGAPSRADGWAYVEDAPGKFGWVSDSAGATLRLDVGLGPAAAGTRERLVVNYLRSYTPEWGTARVEAGGSRAFLDSRTDAQVSQIVDAQLEFEDPGAYGPRDIAVTIINEGGKVKVVEVFLYSCF